MRKRRALAEICFIFFMYINTTLLDMKHAQQMMASSFLREGKDPSSKLAFHLRPGPMMRTFQVQVAPRCGY